MTLTLEDTGETVLTGAVVDQAALHSLLRKIRDLGLPLVSVLQVNVRQSLSPDDTEFDPPHSHQEKNT